MHRSLQTIGLLVLLLAAGCIRTNRFQAVRDDLLLGDKLPIVNKPPSLGREPPPVPAFNGPIPSLTIQFDKNENWNISLQEAIANGMRNSGIVRVLGSSSTGPGSSVSASSTTGFDPAIAEAQLAAALAAFDAQITTAYFYNRINEPPNSFFGPGIPEIVRQNQADFSAAITKPTMTGAIIKAAYDPPIGYLFYPNGGFGAFNPQFTATTEFSVSQPLLQGAGLAVNKAPIRVAQIKVDQSSWDLKQSVMASVRSITQAYWDLQAAHVALRAIEDLLPLLQEMVRLQQELLDAQRVIRSDVAKARAQLHLYRQQQLAARSTVVQKELVLRNLIGLQPGDGKNLIPAEMPVRAPLTLDNDALVMTSLENRPDLIKQRLNIQIRELQVFVARNSMLPQLNVNALYRMNGLQQTLGSALDQMLSSQYADYQFGVSMSMPLGRRLATANMRSAQMTLEREKALLGQQINVAVYQLSDIVRQISFTEQQCREAEARLLEGNEWLKGARLRYENPLASDESQNLLVAAINDYLMAMRFRADAATDLAGLTAIYNGQLAALEEAMGTILNSAGVQLVNDPVDKTRVTHVTPLAPWKREGPLFFNYVSKKLAGPPAFPVATKPFVGPPPADTPQPGEPVYTPKPDIAVPPLVDDDKPAYQPTQTAAPSPPLSTEPALPADGQPEPPNANPPATAPEMSPAPQLQLPASSRAAEPSAPPSSVPVSQNPPAPVSPDTPGAAGPRVRINPDPVSRPLPSATIRPDPVSRPLPSATIKPDPVSQPLPSATIRPEPIVAQ